MLSAAIAERNELQSHTPDVADIADKPVYTAIHDYLKVVSGSHAETVRQPGLYLVHEDLLKVKRFCRHVYELPVKYQEVVNYLGYSETHVEGLGPNRMVQMHKDLQEVADIWSSAESRMLDVGSSLITFNGDLSAFGGAIIDLIRSMEGYKSHQGVVGDVSPDQLNAMPHTPLLDSDRRALPSLTALTQELVITVDGYRNDAQKVKAHIEYFRSELRRVRGDIARKLALAAAHDGNDLTVSLNRQILDYNAQIEEVGRTYNTYTNYFWVGGWWGPLGLAITASIYGFKASRVKDQHNDLIAKKRELESRLSNVSNVMSGLLALETDLQNIQLLTEEALSGAGNLENIWTVISSYITSSVQRIKNTDSATTLFIFEARLSHMISQWTHVENEARILMKALNQDAEE